jgi:hypothetical protein
MGLFNYAYMLKNILRRFFESPTCTNDVFGDTIKLKHGEYNYAGK